MNNNIEVLKSTLYFENSEYVNDLTIEMDKHLIKSTRPDGWGTYIETHKRRKNGMTIRYPGATRGHIEVNDDFIITKIALYKDTCFGDAIGCYKDTVNDTVKSFIGKKIEFEDIKKSENGGKS